MRGVGKALARRELGLAPHFSKCETVTACLLKRGVDGCDLSRHHKAGRIFLNDIGHAHIRRYQDRPSRNHGFGGRHAKAFVFRRHDQ